MSLENSVTKPIKVVITGAAGNIGYNLSFRVGAGEAFGKNVKINLSLLDLAVPQMEGLKMELDDCAYQNIDNIDYTDNSKLALQDADWVIAVGAAPRKAGMERSDLINMNAKIFANLGKTMNEHANSDVKLLVVGNPCNTNCLVAMLNAPRLKRENFFCMTMLDQNRATYQLANKLNAKVESVKKVIIFGNHSSTQYPDIYNCMINNKKLDVNEVGEDWIINSFIPTIQKRGEAIINVAGRSSVGSASQAIVDTLNYLNGLKKGIFSVGLVPNCEYSITETDIIYSMPVEFINNKNMINTTFEHGDFAMKKLKTSLDELIKERDIVKKSGLIDTKY